MTVAVLFNETADCLRRIISRVRGKPFRWSGDVVSTNSVVNGTLARGLRFDRFWLAIWLSN